MRKPSDLARDLDIVIGKLWAYCQKEDWVGTTRTALNSPLLEVLSFANTKWGFRVASIRRTDAQSIYSTPPDCHALAEAVFRALATHGTTEVSTTIELQQSACIGQSACSG